MNRRELFRTLAGVVLLPPRGANLASTESAPACLTKFMDPMVCLQHPDETDAQFIRRSTQV